MDIKVTEFQAPKIVINFEDLKAELQKQLESYSGLVVTEDTLAGCKAAQKELAGLRSKIDSHRKEKKKELEKPIKDFEAQCKELVALVESVEKPIKDGIKVFDDAKREEKRQTALEIIAEVAAANELNEKYAAQLTVIDKYMNLTATKKAVKEDVETRAFALKVEQDREAERLQIIQSVIDSENARITTKIKIEQYQRDIDRDTPTSEIIALIKEQAKIIYEAENKPKEPVVEQQPTETPPEPEKAENEPQAQPEPLYKVTFDVVGDLATQKKVSEFFKTNGINYTVASQIEI